MSHDQDFDIVFQKLAEAHTLLFSDPASAPQLPRLVLDQSDAINELSMLVEDIVDPEPVYFSGT